MKSVILIRIAAVLTLLHAILHTIGGVYGKPAPGMQEATVQVMKANQFPLMGNMRSFWDFYHGMGLALSISMTLEAVVLWLLASLATNHALQLRPILIVFAVGYLVLAVNSYRFFFFGPVVMEIVIAVCLIAAAFAAEVLEVGGSAGGGPGTRRGGGDIGKADLGICTAMKNLGSFLTIVLSAILIPWVIRRVPHLKRPDVAARRAVRAKLPKWVSLTELVFVVASEIGLILWFFEIEQHFHQVFHPESEFIGQLPATFSLIWVFRVIEIFAPMAAAVPLGLILANVVSWLIPPIRQAENKIMAEGVAGYNWTDANMGLVRLAAIVVPVSVIAAFISLTIW